MPILKEYKCSHCGEEFKGTWTDEEAMEEAKELWGDAVADPQTTRVVCDVCFKKFYDPRTGVPDACA